MLQTSPSLTNSSILDFVLFLLPGGLPLRFGAGAGSPSGSTAFLLFVVGFSFWEASDTTVDFLVSLGAPLLTNFGLPGPLAQAGKFRGLILQLESQTVELSDEDLTTVVPW